MAKNFTDTFRKDLLDSYFSGGLIAFLINDTSAPLTVASTMATAAAVEIASTNGYARTTATVAGATGTATASTSASQIIFTASGGSMPAFTKICYCKGGNTTRGDITGKLIAWEDVTGSPLTLGSGQTFKHTLSNLSSTATLT